MVIHQARSTNSHWTSLQALFHFFLPNRWGSGILFLLLIDENISVIEKGGVYAQLWGKNWEKIEYNDHFWIYPIFVFLPLSLFCLAVLRGDPVLLVPAETLSSVLSLLDPLDKVWSRNGLVLLMESPLSSTDARVLCNRAVSQRRAYITMGSPLLIGAWWWLMGAWMSSIPAGKIHSAVMSLMVGWRACLTTVITCESGRVGERERESLH